MTDEQKQDTPIVEPKKEDKKGLFHHGCKNCEKHKAEAEEYKADWQRALADYQNLQKETAARRTEWAKYSEQQILEEFIPVYEHLKMAVQGANESDSWLVGVKHVMKQFSDILKAHDVEEIKTVGEKFDPNLHEAVGEELVEGKEVGEIIREVAGGYKMGERVIRAAKVITVK